MLMLAQMIYGMIMVAYCVMLIFNLIGFLFLFWQKKTMKVKHTGYIEKLIKHKRLKLKLGEFHVHFPFS